MITPLLISISFANPTHGFEMEFYPQSSWEQYKLQESLDHPLSINQLQWIPWGTATGESLSLQYTLLPRFAQNTVRTTDTTETQRFGQVILGMDIEKNWTTADLQWSMGLGTIGNIPLWSIKSSQYTNEEQEDIDTQASVQKSEIRQLGIRFPLATSFYVKQNVQLCIGIVPTWLMNWGYTEYAIQWTHHLDGSPTISIRFLHKTN